MRKVLLFILILGLINVVRVVYSQSTVFSAEARYAIGTVCITDPSQAPSWDSMTSYGTNSWWTFDPWSCDNCDMYVRLRFNIPEALYGSIDRLDIEIRSDDGHTVWVNGQGVGSAGGGCHAGGAAQRTYNIKPYLQPGENEIVIWCSEAWGDEYCFFRLFITSGGSAITVDYNQNWLLTNASFSNISTTSLDIYTTLPGTYSSISNTSLDIYTTLPSIFDSSRLSYNISNFAIISYRSDIIGNTKVTNLTIRYDVIPDIEQLFLLFLYNTTSRMIVSYPTSPAVYIDDAYIGNVTSFRYCPTSPRTYSIRIIDNYTDLKTAVFIFTNDPFNSVIGLGVEAFMGRLQYALGAGSTVDTSRTIDFLYAIPVVINLKDRAMTYYKNPIALFYLNLETTGLKNIIDPSLACNRIYIMYYNPVTNRLERVPFFVDRFACSTITTRIPIFVALPRLSEFSNLLYFVFITNETAELQNPTELFLFYADLSRTAYYRNLRVLATQNVTYDILGGLYARLRANDIFSIIIE